MPRFGVDPPMIFYSILESATIAKKILQCRTENTASTGLFSREIHIFRRVLVEINAGGYSFTFIAAIKSGLNAGAGSRSLSVDVNVLSRNAGSRLAYCTAQTPTCQPSHTAFSR
jgi:hypothetical protein